MEMIPEIEELENFTQLVGMQIARFGFIHEI
jgi:hypothetical protein